LQAAASACSATRLAHAHVVGQNGSFQCTSGRGQVRVTPCRLPAARSCVMFRLQMLDCRALVLLVYCLHPYSRDCHATLTSWSAKASAVNRQPLTVLRPAVSDRPHAPPMGRGPPRPAAARAAASAPQPWRATIAALRRVLRLAPGCGSRSVAAPAWGPAKQLSRACCSRDVVKHRGKISRSDPIGLRLVNEKLAAGVRGQGQGWC
jgi:hypothetical protein